MSNKIKAAFLVVAPESNKEADRGIIKSNLVDLLTVMVKNYKEAVEVSKELVRDGYQVIELCAGFGNKGVNMISEAISYKIPVGVVRFDHHPAFDNSSGDTIFS